MRSSPADLLEEFENKKKKKKNPAPKAGHQVLMFNLGFFFSNFVR
jgi:hypothetical protein